MLSISKSSVGPPPPSLFISFLGFTYIELQVYKLLPKSECRFYLGGMTLRAACYRLLNAQIACLFFVCLTLNVVRAELIIGPTCSRLRVHHLGVKMFITLIITLTSAAMPSFRTMALKYLGSTYTVKYIFNTCCQTLMVCSISQ